MAKRKTEEEFIKQAKEIYKKENYDYSSVKYNGSKNKISVICPIHGIFNVGADGFLSGNGCVFCGFEKRVKNLTATKEEFVERANCIHCGKYNYSLVNYINMNTKVEIICSQGHHFFQIPYTHIKGHGCRYCADQNGGKTQLLGLDIFIQRSNEIHNGKYLYEKSIYKSVMNKLIITCPIHGDFLQSPNDHLRGSGCKKCAKFISNIGNKWLDSINIPDDTNHREVEFLIPKRRFVVDGYMPNTNTIYEFYGDMAHGNPNLYLPNDICPLNKNTYKHCYDKTMEREQIFKDAGYNVVSIWESEFKQQQIDLAISRI